jgi:hypothetical protein
MSAKSQMDRVLDAVLEGARTSVEVRDITDLPIKHVSAYLRYLELEKRVIKRVGTRRFSYGSGRFAVEYELVA